MKTIEEKIEGAVWVLLLDGVNDFLGSIDDDVPLVERNTGGFVARRSPQGGWRVCRASGWGGGSEQ